MVLVWTGCQNRIGMTHLDGPGTDWVPPEFSEDITLGIHFTHIVTIEIDYSIMSVKGGTQCVACLDRQLIATLHHVVLLAVCLRFVVTSWRSLVGQ